VCDGGIMLWWQEAILNRFIHDGWEAYGILMYDRPSRLRRWWCMRHFIHDGWEAFRILMYERPSHSRRWWCMRGIWYSWDLDINVIWVLVRRNSYGVCDIYHDLHCKLFMQCFCDIPLLYCCIARNGHRYQHTHQVSMVEGWEFLCHASNDFGA